MPDSNECNDQLKLAVVEDDKGVADLMIRHLNSFFGPCVIRIAHSLDEAWEIISQEKFFDIIFLDLNLPPHTAEDTLKVIPKFLQHCNQLIIVSGLDALKYEAESLKQGASGYMSKLESLRTTSSFVDRLVGIYKAIKGDSKGKSNLAKLEQIIAKYDPPENYESGQTQ